MLLPRVKRPRADHSAERKDGTSYDPRLKAVADAAANVAPPGDFSLSGEILEFPHPGLHIDQVGFVPLPIDSVMERVVCRNVASATMAGPLEKSPLASHKWCTKNPEWAVFLWELVERSRISLGVSRDVKLLVNAKALHLGELVLSEQTKQDPRVLGTLVVVLPSQFEGGDIVISDSTRSHKPHRWSPSADHPLALKYAIFYNCCLVKSTPVMHGTQMCLTYDLIVTQILEYDLHRYAWNCITEPDWHRATTFVHVLREKYKSTDLKFTNLSAADELLAASLAKFCDESRGSVTLYLCRLDYGIKWAGHRHDRDARDFKDHVTLTEWVPYREKDDTIDLRNCMSSATIHAEVAPVGFFDNDDLDYDSKFAIQPFRDSGHDVSASYRSAALVLIPRVVQRGMQFGDDPIRALAEWSTLTITNATLASRVTSAFAANPQDWSLTTREGEAVLDGVARLHRLSTLQEIVLSCQKVRFQPKLRDVVASFHWSIAVTTLQEMCTRWGRSSRNSLNLVTSVLDRVTDPDQIASLLDAISLEPLPEVSASELARVLQLARRVALARLETLLGILCTDEPPTFSGTTEQLSVLVAPAVRILVHRLASVDRTDPLRELVRMVTQTLRTQLAQYLETRIARASVACPFQRDGWRFTRMPLACTVCDTLQRFLGTPTERSLPLSGHKLPHMTACLACSRLDDVVQVVAGSSSSSSANGHKPMLIKSCTARWYTRGLEEVRALDALLARWDAAST